MENIIKVLFIVNNLNIGGAQKHTVDLVNSLDRDKFDAHIVSLKKPNPLYDKINKELHSNSLLMDVKRKFSLSAVRKISTYIDKKDIDVIVCVNRYSMVYGVLAGIFCKNKPYIIEIFHTTLIDGFKNKLLLIVHRIFFRLCCLVVFVSKNQKGYWVGKRRLWLKDSVVVTNGIDPVFFDDCYSQVEKEQIASQVNFNATDYVVGICAALRKEKQHVDLVDAVALARDKGCDVKLLIIGDGPMRGDIEARIKAKGLSGFTHVTGFKSDVRPYISICGCVVISSHFIETFSLAALEAMAMKKPMVMTNIGGADEQVVHGVNGYIYPKGDIEALADYVIKLSDPEIRARMGGAARREVLEKFTLQRMQRKYEEILLHLG